MEIKKDKKVIITRKKYLSGSRDIGWDLRNILAGKGIVLRRDQSPGNTVKHGHSTLPDPLRSKTLEMSHYCWKCGQYLANEKFSGKGHARHICKKCMAEERAHRRQILKEKRERGEIPELKLKPVSSEIVEYSRGR